jgi:hypothetical protein
MKKSELNQLIREEISKMNEGFLDRTKAKVLGTTSYVGTGISNIGKSFLGKKDQIKDPTLVKGITMLQQKAKTFEKEIDDILNDVNILFPSTKLKQGPAELTKLISAYKSILNQAKSFNAQISSGILPQTQK